MSPEDVQKEIEQLEQRFAENSKGLVFAHLADAYRKAGEFGKAEGLILHGLKNHPNYISAYNVLGRVYLDSERFPEAHEQFSKVLELDPHNLIALRALGDLAIRNDEPAAARSWYERMLQVDPRNEEAREELKKLEEAEHDAGPAVPAEPAAGAPAASDAAIGQEDRPVAAPQPEPEPEPSAPKDEDLKIVDSPGLETAAHYEEQHLPADESWDFGPLDMEGEADEDDASVGPLEGLLSDQDLAGLTDKSPGEAEDWPGLDRIGGERDAEREDAVDHESPAGADTDRAGGEFHLGDMEDWTPGFISDEELTEANAGVQDIGEDFNFDLLGQDDDDEEVEAVPEVQLSDVEFKDELDDSGLVTETMAELYARQGFYQDALKVYEQLAEIRPNDERIRSRIAELRNKLADDQAAVSEDEELAALLELTEPAAQEPAAPAEEARGPTDDLETHAVPPEPAAPQAHAEAERVEEPREPEPPADERPAAAARPIAEEESEGGFEFEDEAPFAGLEHLDPFAASFEVFVKRDGQPARAASAPLLPEAAPTPPEPEPEIEEVVEAEPAPAELTEEPLVASVEEAEAEMAEIESGLTEDDEELSTIAGDVGADEVEAETFEPWARREEEQEEAPSAVESALEEEAPEPFGAFSEAEVAAAEEEIAALDEAADVEAEPADIEEEIGEPAPVTAPVETEELEVSIEDYLSSLLAYEIGSASARAAATPLDVAPDEAESPPEHESSAEPPVGEDLEEFQEWLRSLKR